MGGLFGRIGVRIGPKGGEARRMGQGGTYGRTDGQIPPVFYRTSSPLGPLPKNGKRDANKVSIRPKKTLFLKLTYNPLIRISNENYNHSSPILVWVCFQMRILP